MPLVAILIPVYRSELLPDEQISLIHLRHHLGRYDLCQISPKSGVHRLAGFKLKEYDESFFTSVSSYSRLMLSREFYRDFTDYEYLLIYQLDCLVFSNDLAQWCERGFDYVGAPLFNVKSDPNSGFSGACNGGLSLRRVSSFLQVLDSSQYLDEKVCFLADLCRRSFLDVRPLPWFKRLQKRIQVARAVRQGVERYLASYSVNEDHFWSGRASYFHSGFRIAPPEVALEFAFEVGPRYCFERNGRRLAFGAHAWAKWDRAFWEPYLIES